MQAKLETDPGCQTNEMPKARGGSAKTTSNPVLIEQKDSLQGDTSALAEDCVQSARCAIVVCLCVRHDLPSNTKPWAVVMAKVISRADASTGFVG